MNKKNTLITVTIALGLVIVALITTLIVFIVNNKVYAQQLENVYMRSFYELSNNIDDIEVDMSKLIATNSKSVRKDILADVYNTCNVANTNISNLPLSNNNIQKINEFVNKLGGFSFSLIEKINKEQEWSSQDISSIGELHSHSLKLMFDFNQYISSLSFDFQILNQIDFNNDTNNFNNSFNNIQNTNSEIPTLIYDGPFAESVLNPDIKGLPDNEITKEAAEQYIRDNFTTYDIKDVKFVNETNGIFTTYNFKLSTTNNLDLFIQLSKKGGILVEITSIGTGGEQNLSVGECQEIAKTFARNLGFNDMYPVWSTVNGKVAYVNLAPIVSGVIYYPDLIKVKVDRLFGLVTGWESRSYCYNHTARSLPTPALTLTQAQEKVSSLLTVIEKNKALIPNKFSGETLTYEFICTWKDYTYYVYINSITGEEANILRVIKTNQGDLIL